MKTTFTYLCLAAAAACSGRTSFEPVEVTNLPCLTGRLATPIVIQASYPNGTASVAYNGGALDNPRDVHIMLEQDAAQSLDVRIGQCKITGVSSTSMTADCREPRWLGEPQHVEIDTRQPNPKLAVQFPTLQCIGGVAIAP
jgi:hypothetical protein